MARKTLKELREERAAKFIEVDNASKIGDAEQRSLTDAEMTTFDKLGEELRAIDAEIEKEVKLDNFAQIRSITVGSGSDAGNRDTSPGDQRDLSKFNLLRALNMKLENQPLDGIEAEVNTMGTDEAKRGGLELSGNGIVVPNELLQKRGQTVTLQTANPGDQGGVFVEKKLNGVLEVLQANTFLDKVGARFLTGLKGDQVFPVQDTVPTIQELTEIEAMTDSEILFSSFDMKPQRRGVSIPISRQTLIQASIDMQNFVVDAMGEAFSQKMNAEAIVLLLAAITSGNGNLLALATNGDLPDYNDIVALEALVEGYNHLRGNPAYLTNTKVKAILKTTQKFASTNGDPVWDREGLNGYRAVTSNIVPSNITKGTGTGLSPIIFGNFSDHMVGVWSAVEYIVDPYTLKKKAQIEITANAFWNQKVARVKSFAGIKDAISVRP